MSRIGDDLFELGKVLNNYRASQIWNVDGNMEKNIKDMATAMVDEIRDDLKVRESYDGSSAALWSELVTALTIYTSAQIRIKKEKENG